MGSESTNGVSSVRWCFQWPPVYSPLVQWKRRPGRKARQRLHPGCRSHRYHCPARAQKLRKERCQQSYSLWVQQVKVNKRIHLLAEPGRPEVFIGALFADSGAESRALLSPLIVGWLRVSGGPTQINIEKRKGSRTDPRSERPSQCQNSLRSRARLIGDVNTPPRQ